MMAMFVYKNVNYDLKKNNFVMFLFCFNYDFAQIKCYYKHTIFQ